MTNTQQRAITGSVGLVLSPFTLHAIGTVIVRAFRNVPAAEFLLWLSIAIAIASGLAFLWRLPLPVSIKLSVAPLYSLILGYVLFGYTLYVVGVLFGDWL